MNSNKTPKARVSGLVLQESSDELLIYDLDTDKAHCLNETMAAIWGKCDGTNSLTEIANGFAPEKIENGEDIVLLAVDELQKRNLLDASSTIKMNGTTRRELIKKVGFASVVALPVIASLAAPSSVLAAASCACAAPADCISQPGCPASTCNGSGQCAP